MHLDLRYPIGLLLTIYGAILAIEGATVQTMVTGLNIDLDWGLVMVCSGVSALYLARRRSTPTTRASIDDR